MSFKKTSIVKKDSNALNIIGIVSIGIVFVVALFLIKNINFFKIRIDEQGIINSNNQKEESGKGILSSIFGKKDEEPKEEEITVLVVGRGGVMNDAPDLTDTIILAKANTKNKTVSMLSIPRDLYVKYPGNDRFEGKINGIYSRYFYQSKSEDTGMKMLAQKITEITGEEIDYYINVDFNGFIEIIDTIGGIVIEIPEDFVDYEYPDNNWGYRTLRFKKGTWLFDGEDALKYVRSRHSTSDFDRSLRQQQVINSIKNKLLSTYLITSPSKIKELYNVFNKNVITDISLTKMIDLAYTFRNIEEFSIVSSNMNDSCFYGSGSCTKGGILYVPLRDLFNGISVLLFYGSEKGSISNYELPKTYSNIIFNYPGVETEGLTINVLNSVKVSNLAYTFSNNVVRYGFNISKLGNTDNEYEVSKIYYNNVPENSQTIEALKLFFDGEFIETEFPMYSQDNANIEIVLGKDYLGKGSIFKF